MFDCFWAIFSVADGKHVFDYVAEWFFERSWEKFAWQKIS